MIDVEKYAEYYWLNKITGGRQRVREELVETFGSVRDVREAGKRGDIDYSGFLGEKSLSKLDPEGLMKEALAVMERVSRDGTGVVCRDDENYPELLLESRGSPLILYYEGRIEEVNRHRARIAAVGSRKCTSYGREMCVRMVSALGGKDICVVSGMARGIDSFSHRAALDSGLFTAAVLGCGTNVIYPGENAGLYSRIKENGVIISEQPPDTQPFRSFFPARNRIIAGMSEATLVVEAGLSSGALITADFALDGGREVLAIPHRIDTPEGAGCNDLLKNGAVLITSPADLLNALGFEENSAGASDMMPEALDRNQAEIFSMIKRNGELYEDEIASETSMSSRDIKRALSALEIFGFIKKDFGGKYYGV